MSLKRWSELSILLFYFIFWEEKHITNWKRDVRSLEDKNLITNFISKKS